MADHGSPVVVFQRLLGMKNKSQLEFSGFREQQN
jgi:hypothetical protein